MSGPYCRLYWSVMDDAKFDGIREDPRLFGSWALLLVVADMAWPVPAYVPPTIRRGDLAKLVDCGLIDRIDAHRFRVHGLDRERGERRQSARNAAALRWHSTGNAETMPSRAEHSRAEPSRTREGLPDLSPGAESAWEWATGRTVLASGAWVAEYLDDACRRHGTAKVVAAIEAARPSFDAIPEPRSLTVAVRAILDPLPRGDNGAAERAKSKRGVAATLRYTHDLGAHADQPHPDCPACAAVPA